MRSILFSLIFVAGKACAQWGGFIDPNIIREAGDCAISGNCFQVEAPPTIINIIGPSAADIVNESNRQNIDLQAQRAALIRQALIQKIHAHIRLEYETEFRK